MAHWKSNSEIPIKDLVKCSRDENQGFSAISLLRALYPSSVMWWKTLSGDRGPEAKIGCEAELLRASLTKQT